MLVQINRKGQLTVPQQVRQQLGLHPGDVLELEVKGETLILRPRATAHPVIRGNPPEMLRAIEGLAAAGGHALEDTERLYDRS